ncbi:T9SS type A sorting domain-containing protein [candidate division KSB1 bacterium]|nr:T9SS type A sorting domain-containing protein [candidate division KSB1 bacterium]
MSKRLLCLVCFILVMGLATVVSADLLAHYKLDETGGTVATDASGNGFDGTVNGNTNWTSGNLGGALEFTGDCNVTLPAEVMGLTSVIGSVAFWMNAGTPTGINTMFWAGDNTTGGGFGPENEMHVHLESAVTDVWVGGELSFFAIADPVVHLHSDPAKGEAPGTVPVDPLLLGDLFWHHVAAVWDGDNGNMKLFADGLLVMEKPYSFLPYDLTNIFLGQMGGANRTYIGLLDDVRIYSNALSDEDVYFLYEGLEDHVSDNPVASPQAFVLNQNYPNPFNPSTTINYQLAKNSDVLLTVFNQTGQKVRTLVQEQQGSGIQSVIWDGRDDAGQQQSSGIYLYRLQIDNKVQTRKMMLIK